MLKVGIRRLDGVFLTHGHADAILGLDDLRHWAGHHPAIQPYVDVYCDEHTMAVVERTFPYLVDKSKATGGGEVGTLRFHVFSSPGRVQIGELNLQVIPVEHGLYSNGSKFYCQGFSVHGLLYLSDISGIPKESEQFIFQSGKELGLLILDCLFENGQYQSHYCWPQSRQLMKALKPRSSILVGMAHTIDYHDFQKTLDRSFDLPGKVIVGFDGLLYTKSFQ